MQIAPLARLIPERFVPGLSHGVLDRMGTVGARAESPSMLLREQTAAVRELLHGHRVDVEGRYVHLHAVALVRPPTQQSPLLLGGARAEGAALGGGGVERRPTTSPGASWAHAER